MPPLSLELALISWMAMAAVMGGLWLVQRVHQNVVIADVGWCVGFGLVAIGYGIEVEGDPTRRILLTAMGSIYAFRLAFHLFFNRVLRQPEDGRYQSLRHKWGPQAQLYFFLYFQGQAVAIAMFSLPLLVLMHNPHSPWGFWDIVGILLWLIAIIGETIADRQLAQFRADPRNRGKTYRDGLWYYSRHPNYFFEGLHWCAYVVMGIGIPYGWLTLLGPVLMVWALLKISGIPFAESQALANRGEDYRAYQRTTNAFIPWFPKASGQK